MTCGLYLGLGVAGRRGGRSLAKTAGMSVPRPDSAARWRRFIAVCAIVIAVLGAGQAARLVTGLFSAARPAPRHGQPREVRTARVRHAAPRPAAPSIGALDSYAVGELSLTVFDQPDAGTGPADAASAVLPVVVRYPVAPGSSPGVTTPAAGPFPLVVFAPGYLQCGSYYADLLNAWASAGYVVAVVKFPETNCDVGDDGDEDYVANQPAEVSAVISKLVAMSATPGWLLSGRVNAGAIGLAGHSDGADTVAALAANTCCADHRVDAAVVMAGATWPALGGGYFQSATPPMLFVQGDEDPVHPPSATLNMYSDDTTGPRYYLDVLGAGHFTPYEGDGPQEQLVARVTLEFFDRYLAGQAQARAAMLSSGNVSGVAALVHGGALPAS